MAEFSVVGQSVSRIDALEKVTGRALYCSDRPVATPRLLHGKCLFSPHAHARIISIDTSQAEQLPGVIAVITGKDGPEGLFGDFYHDQPIPARDVVRFAGETVAAVAATSPETASQAIDLIKVKYEPLPAVLDVEEAFKKEPPVILHQDISRYEKPFPFITASVIVDLEGRPNLNSHYKVRKGDVEKAFSEADLIVENRYEAGRFMHAQLETYNCIAQTEADGCLTIWTSLQCLYRIRGILCRTFKLPPSKVRMIGHYIGGAFGGYPRVEQIAATLAFKTGGRPVKLALNREEYFRYTSCRAHNVIYVKDGVKKDGTIIAREVKLMVDGGAYAEFAAVLASQGGMTIAPLYNIPNVKLDGYTIYTNTLPAGPLRGAGQTQPNWALERQMDVIASRLGIDPAEVRRKNLLKEGDKNCLGEIMHSMRAIDCLDRAAKWIGWGQQPPTSPHKHIKIGRGIGLGNKRTFVGTTSNAYVKVYTDGSLQLQLTVDEIGQGTHTAMAQIAAEEFNTSVDKVRVIHGDTAFSPYDYGSIASRTTFYTGNAVRLACQDAKRQLFEIAAAKLEVASDKMAIKDSIIYAPGSPDKSIALSDMFSLFLGGTGTVRDHKEHIIGKGSFTYPASPYDWETGQVKEGGRVSAYYAEGATAVEVAVDTETGNVQVVRACSVFNMGQPINPKMVEGQLEGGLYMGIGNALYEELQLDENGVVTNPSFRDYRIPSVGQMPTRENMEVFIDPMPHSGGPFGAKAVGEGVLLPVAPAIANAIYNAVGVELNELPMTAERVLKAIKAQKAK
ncbi:xanthine dehydrogenase family protein molybdopterin-binding subunit [Chloroflexota bacterium]